MLCKKWGLEMGTGNVEGLTVVSIDESSTISKTASQIFSLFPPS